MDEGKFVAEFVSANLEKIYAFWQKVYGKLDASIQVNLKTAYTDYLNNSRLKYSKSKSFFIRHQPVELYSYYVSSGIQCGNKVINNPDYDECLEFTKRIVITGTGGSGKSVLMKHLFLNCIQKKSHTPILIELRDLNTYEKSLNDFITETLSNLGFNTTEEYLVSAKEAGHFCYIFDGFDEVTPKLRSKLLKQIISISNKFPNCPLIISSRPDDTLTGLNDFSTFRMMPLSLSKALELVKKLPFDEAIKHKFCHDMSNGLFERHESFLSNPLLLSIMLLTYGEYAEIPSKLSIFYNQAFEALFRRHDAYKGAYSRDRLTTLDIQDFSRVFALFSLQTYEKRVFKMQRSLCLDFIQNSMKILRIEADPNDYLIDLLNAACLLVEDGVEIAFSHRSFQEYFVALYIASASPENQEKLINRFWQNLASDNVMKLLNEINPDLFERALLVPKLEEFFKEINVKKSIGISHFLNYIKIFYSHISFDHNENGGVMFIFHKSGNTGYRVAQNQLLKIAVKNYSNYVFKSPIEIVEDSESLYEKYFSQVIEYETSTLNMKSPLVKDFNTVGSWHSSHYLSAAYNVYKELKAKHVNTPLSFDILLGLR